MVESFGFWGRKFCIKNVEILSVGKIAEFAKFAGGKRRKSPDLISFYERSELLGRGPTESLRALGADADKDINLSVSVRWGLDGCLLDKLALARGQVPLFIDVRPVAGHREMTVGINECRFATRAWACGRESGIQRFSQNR